jgi:predicted ribosomally synthesized peptide with nif11-like leader
MSKEAFLAFQEKVKDDTELRKRIDAIPTTSDAASDDILALAQAAGFSFTEEQWAATIKEQLAEHAAQAAASNRELSATELEEVAGGVLKHKPKATSTSFIYLCCKSSS